jgi:hypothetical protein
MNTDNSFCFQSVSIRVHPWLTFFWRNKTAMRAALTPDDENTCDIPACSAFFRPAQVTDSARSRRYFRKKPISGNYLRLPWNIAGAIRIVKNGPNFGSTTPYGWMGTSRANIRLAKTKPIFVI